MLSTDYTINQCCHTTQKDKQCKSKATEEQSGKKYCWRHYKIVDDIFKKHEMNFFKLHSKHDVEGNVEYDHCKICSNVLNNPENIVATNCKHFFHLNCLMKWKDDKILRKDSLSCPKCVKPIHLYRYKLKYYDF